MDTCSELFVVGMGASAGGLETFQRFFKYMPPDSGLAFVLVQHLHPEHESLMPELLSKSTEMVVSAAREGMKIEANHVYVIAANTTLTVHDGRLHTAKPCESRGHRMPIDHFFKSLSEDYGERAICIVLSGTGSDGTLGLKAVKEHGGLAIAQTPETAKYDAMVRNAIQTGLVDMVLDIADMPAHIQNIAAKGQSLRQEIEEDGASDAHLDSIFKGLEDHSRHEFKGYKRNTIMRRIQRRMQVLQIDSLAAYAKRVRADKQETDNLFKDLLIGVTHFFRDPDSFAYLQERIIPGLLRTRRDSGESSGLRLWIPGCATGEEAYTLALIVREEAAKIEMSLPVQIFATDINESGLQTARRAEYPEGIAEQVPERLLTRYFSRKGNQYHLHKHIREMCIFSPHNIISDPPYSRIDLIVCRNLLIYFDNELQRKILPIFHYSLISGGYLFLGPSENISARPELFKTVSRTHKIFQARKNVPPMMLEFSPGRQKLRREDWTPRAGSEQKRESEKMLARIFERKVLEHHVPFCAAINDHGDILYWAGPQAKYLDLPRGVPRNNMLEITHKSLRLTLRNGLHKVVSTGEEFEQRNVVVQTSDGLQKLMVSLSPFREMGDSSGLIFMVIRELGPPTDEPGTGDQPPITTRDEFNRQLEEELKDTKAHLQATIEELETSNEELKSSNEELLSMNEELQSSNEELQTSKEELQSVNEELETVNAELKNKVRELDDANSDLQNLYESSRIATLFLDNELRIKTFTPTVTELFRLIESDAGRPIGDIVRRFEGADLVVEARQVLKTLERRQLEVRSKETDRSYLLQVLPYRTVKNSIDGVTVSFVDITDLKKARQELEIRERMLRLVTNSVPVLIAYVDRDLRYRYCNAEYEEWFDLGGKTMLGKTVREVLGDSAYAKIRTHLEAALVGQAVQFEVTLDFRLDGTRTVGVHYEPHRLEDGSICGVIAFIQDLSERIERVRNMGRLAAIVNSSHEAIIGKNTDCFITDWNRGAEALFGYSAADAIGEHISLIIPQERQSALEPLYEKVRRGEDIAPFETVRLHRDGSLKNVLISLSPIRNDEGKILGISTVAHDITQRLEAESKLAEFTENLEQMVAEKTELLRALTARFLNFEQAERRRFSQLLHDEIQQSLAAAKLLVEQAADQAEEGDSTPPFSEALRLLNGSIAQTRSLAMDLSPPLFFESGIGVCLEWLVRWTKSKHDLQVALTVAGEDRPIREETGYMLFRSIKELLFNAYKHAGVRDISVDATWADDGALKVTVADKGEGFDPDHLETVSNEHFGLLSIMEQVRALDGELELDTDSQRGTRITISLPPTATKRPRSGDGDSAPIETERLTSGNSALMESSEGKIPILIVDDQEDLRFTLRLMLEDLTDEYVFLEAENAEQAVAAVRQFKPRLVLMDISMPGTSGVEATGMIRAEDTETKIIGLSMHDREDMEQAMLEAGADSYLTKDANSKEILRTIEACLADGKPQ